MLFFQNGKWPKIIGYIILVVLAFGIGWALRISYGGNISSSAKALRNALIENFQSDSQYYDVKMSYPAVEGTAGKDVASFVTSRLNEFKDGFNQLSADDIKIMGLGADPERRWTLNLGVAIATSSKYTTFVFEEYTYTGGAHGNTHFYTFTYDDKAQRVQLYDLVSKDKKSQGLEYLELVSSSVRAKLYTTLIDSEYTTRDQIDAGTEPVAENFKSFYTVDVGDHTELVFIFDPYTIGAYVLGSQRVQVDLLRPNQSNTK